MMARIVCVHGIAQQLKGPEILMREWSAALRDGMRLAGARYEELPADGAIGVAFFGDLFRKEIIKGSREHEPAKGYIPYTVADIEEGFEEDLLRTWAKAAGVIRADGDAPADPNKAGWAPRSVQAIARALLGVQFFAGLTDRLLVGALKQVRLYFTEPETRQVARDRLSSLLSAETRLVIGHSLGSVVAYEALCRATDPVAPALVTIGSPLGLRNLIFDRLDPAPVDGKGAWPSATRSWTNIADRHDLVASEKRLNGFFQGDIVDVEVNNEALAHDIGPYFTAKETGAAVLKALREI